jgi:hypothetical protein
VDIRWKDRKFAREACVLQTPVLPGGDEVLLGALPLEGLDLMIHPKTEEVIGAHGEKRYNVVK